MCPDMHERARVFMLKNNMYISCVNSHIPIIPVIYLIINLPQKVKTLYVTKFVVTFKDPIVGISSRHWRV